MTIFSIIKNNRNINNFRKSELIYHIDDCPPIAEIIFLAFQHLLAMCLAVITPALIICQSLNLPIEDTKHIVSMSLFSSGLASILQIKTWGPIGSGLLSIQGTSFNFVNPLIIAGTTLKDNGADITTMMATLFGTLMIASFTEIFISRILHLLKDIITPLISGIIVVIIGISLIQVSLISIGGGVSAITNHSFGEPKNIILAASVLFFILLFHRQNNTCFRVGSLLISTLIGCFFAWTNDMLPNNVTPLSELKLTIVLPTPLYYGLNFDFSLLLPLILVFIITSFEAVGDITATADVSEQPIYGSHYMNRLKGGVLANGINSMFATIFNTFPNSCFSQNNSLIQLTGVASRYVGFAVAFMLILLGIFPIFSELIQYIPEPVLGGVTIFMFGTIAASGIRILSRENINRRAMIIIALSLSLGLGVSQQPQILQFAPQWVKTLFSSGITTGGITAIILNLFLPIEKK
ncbi:uracil-xanthine permease [Candidatus Schneideria nysicola]|uniref:uracil-xanthine permease family protein n=1 Tax=Candidatus Schneideria nysicola TaxID=1081631 RepID=UPI001CAA59AF|nr:uracil-xanthine permease family protein [Candidatus Schneideria nysicola]UAJ65049.1 uracil-xanthine permease [Candidatus Schneideria nysicola]